MSNHFTDNDKTNQENVAASGRNNLHLVAAYGPCTNIQYGMNKWA
jgi:hypothetical protein